MGYRSRQHGQWARVISAPILAHALKEKNYSLRFAADHCGHIAHQHVMRLASGQTATTTTYTADRLEDLLGMQGLLFTRHSARPANSTKAAA